MAYQIFPAVVASSGGGASTSFFTIANSNRYWANVDLDAGVYDFVGTAAHVSCEVALLDANNTVLTTVTCTGTTKVTVTASSAIKKLRFVSRLYRTSDNRTLMGSIQIGVTLVGELNNTTGFTGTIAEYTTTQPISINGTAYVLAVGGGGGGKTTTNGYSSGGGASGALVEKFATNWSGLYTATIGNGGSAPAGDDAGGTGGTTTLTNTGGTVMSAGGGQGNPRNGANGCWGFGIPANSGGDYAGFSSGACGSNQGGSSQNPHAEPYAAVYQWAKQFSVTGGGGGGSSTSYALNNGADGGGGFHSGGANKNARGRGNGGSGTTGDQAGSGSGGAIWVITGLQEII